ncbi:hypothetical protein OO013_04755 [Mangrovivirga sp. M17]|uniref:Uncharacterized protein n=1 Tax=Mangrovivirga halotolerans TaxID=2993936 RepID=A0ABT3RNI5_9BACT|nr:hypothetical protein [Mangrovivirga halotolerans]MCX2743161.1 hypothetical protein [Mangrovivirga halotolerans]
MKKNHIKNLPIILFSVFLSLTVLSGKITQYVVPTTFEVQKEASADKQEKKDDSQEEQGAEQAYLYDSQALIGPVSFSLPQVYLRQESIHYISDLSDWKPVISYAENHGEIYFKILFNRIISPNAP